MTLPLLNDLNRSALIDIIHTIYGRYDDIDEIVDTHIECQASGNVKEVRGVGRESDSLCSAQAKILNKQIRSLLQQDHFIPYSGAYDFSCRLERLLKDIDLLAEDSPDQALRLTEDLLNAHGALFERADDSDGFIGDVIRRAVDQWLNIAAKVREKSPDTRDWLEAVLAFFNHNDYGCLDKVISHSRVLLTDTELRQLAQRFEADAKNALKDAPSEGYNHKVAHALIGLKSVGEALEDIELFEWGTLIDSPEPNPLQIENIVKFAFQVKALERAEYWLRQPQWEQADDRYKEQKNRLHNELLDIQGNIAQLKHNLLQQFMEAPNEYRLSGYWDIADESEREMVAERVRSLTSDPTNKTEAVSMLLFIGDVGEAGQYLIDHYTHINGEFYGTLLAWIERFQQLNDPLPTIVCYRLLLCDLLDRGYSKAYHHGADYFRALLALDKQNPNYQRLGNAAAFIRMLQKKHWRKRSFWAQAGYPNKS